MPTHDGGPVEDSREEYAKVVTANGESEASAIKSALEAAGIPVELGLEAITRLLPVTVDGLGAVRIMVPADRLEEARIIVNTPAEAIGTMDAAPDDDLDVGTSESSLSPGELRDDRMCFACGADNPDGLGLEFRDEDGEVVASYSFPKKFQGYRSVVHGGLISTVLDEAMVTVVNRRGRFAVTGELQVKFIQPLHVDERFEVRAHLVEARGRIYRLAAVAALSDGREIAAATSTCIDMGPIPE